MLGRRIFPTQKLFKEKLMSIEGKEFFGTLRDILLISGTVSVSNRTIHMPMQAENMIYVTDHAEMADEIEAKQVSCMEETRRLHSIRNFLWSLRNIGFLLGV